MYRAQQKCVGSATTPSETDAVGCHLSKTSCLHFTF